MSEENDFLTSANNVFIESPSNNNNQTINNLLNLDTDVNIIFYNIYLKIYS